MAGFIIKLGKEFPTDNTLCINEKEYAINSIAWQLIDRIHQYLGFDDTTPSILLRYQGILKVIYDNFDHDLINKPVETTNEQPEYELEYININATDCPIKLTNLVTKETRLYGVEGLPWKLLRKDQEIMQYVFNNFKSDI